jgi:hypothetical protein
MENGVWPVRNGGLMLRRDASKTIEGAGVRLCGVSAEAVGCIHFTWK